MLELYHNDMSSCAQKVRLTLAEKRLEWVGHHLDLRAGDQQRPGYLELKVVRESTLIMEYLDDRYPDPPLRPADPHLRSVMSLWNKRLDDGHHDIATSTISMGIAFRFQYFEKGEKACSALVDKIPDPIRRERRRDVIYNGVEAREFRTAAGMWESLLTEMEQALDGGPWLVGSDYTLADAAYTPYLARLDHLSLLGWLDRRPKLSSWCAVSASGPAMKRRYGNGKTRNT